MITALIVSTVLPGMEGEVGWRVGEWEEHCASVQEPMWLHGTKNSISHVAFSKTPAFQNKGVFF